MSLIPTIPGSARVQDQQIGTKINPQARIQALAAGKQAVGAAGAAVTEAISGVADYEERKRKAEEAYAFNASSLSFQKLHSDYLSNAKKLPDQQIVPNWQDTTAQWKQAQMDQYGDKLSPRAKRLFSMNLDSAIGGSTAKFQVMADHLGSQRREAAAVANWNEFLKTGDPGMAAKAEGALRLAVNAGDMTQDKMDFYTSQIQPVLQKNQILNGIGNDAFKTLKKIDAGGYDKVPEAELGTLRNAAEKQVNFVQRETASDAINDFQTTGIPKTKDELQELKKAGKVTGEFVRNYGLMVDRADYHVAEEKQALILTNLRDMKLEDSQNPEKDVREVFDQAASLPPQLQKAIHTLGDEKIKAAKTAQEKTIHDDQLDLMRESYEQSVGRIPVSKRTDTDPAKWAESPEAIREMDPKQFEAEYGKDADQDEAAKNAERYVKAEKQRYANAQKSYVLWSKTKKGQEASPQEAADERERLGFGRYQSPEDVAASYKAGKIDRGTAKDVLNRQFGIQ